MTRLNLTLFDNDIENLKKMAKDYGIKPTSLGNTLVKMALKEYNKNPDEFLLYMPYKK